MAQRLSDPELSTLEPVVDSDETLLSDSTSELNTTELLREHVKPKIHIRRIRNKGAVFVFVWSFLQLLTTVYYYIAYNATRIYCNSNRNVNSVDWNDGMKWWSGLLEWSTGLDWTTGVPHPLHCIIPLICIGFQATVWS